MDLPTHSPRITSLSWGHLETEVGTFKDARLYPGGAEEWDWNQTGTPRSRHTARRCGEIVGARRRGRRPLQGLLRTPRRRTRDPQDAGREAGSDAHRTY